MTHEFSICNELRTLGITANYKGYKQAAWAIHLALDDERRELLNYMNSEQFFEFINQIDVPHINAQKENSASHIKDIQKEMSKTSKSVPKMSLLDKINELNSNDLRKAFESINTIRGNK